jgi:thiamine-phosphate diphosphorylase
VIDLPRLLVLTDQRSSTRPVAEAVGFALEGGARAILLRDKDLPVSERQALAAALTPLVRQHGARLGVASDAALAAHQPRPWLHLAQRDQPFDRSFDAIVGRSCHNVDEVRAAVAEGCDYVIVSPAAPTGSKPGYGPALGIEGVRTLGEAAGSVPFWVLGGVTPANVPDWLAAGAAGVAVMSGIMGAQCPRLATELYLEVIGAPV